MKRKDPRSAALSRALERKSVESHRALYENLIDYEQKHLKECAKRRCVECRDAKALIPYYREQSKMRRRGS